MAVDNTILVRRGSGTPNYTDFVQYELAYDYTNDKLYIRDGNAMIEVGSAPDAAPGDITSVVAGSGLTGGATSGDATLNIGAGTGIDVAADAISVDVSDFMSSGANNRILTATGTDAMNAEANLTFNGSTLAVTGQIDFTSELNFTGAGNKIIDVETLANSNTFRIRHHNPSGNVFHDALVLTGNAGAKLYYNNGLKFETTNSGAQIRGNGGMFTLLGTDHSYIQFFPDGSSAGRKAFIGQGSSSNDGFTIANESSDADIVIKVKDGSSLLSAMIFDASNVGRVILPNDNQQLTIGAGYDLNFYNNGSASYIQNNNNVLYINQTAANTMQIRNSSSNQDITFSVNDGGSQITALQIDASENGSLFMFNDNAVLGIGAGNDLRLWHDGTNSNIYNYQGNLNIGNTVDNADTFFYGDDGSGNMTSYFYLDGSSQRIIYDKAPRFFGSAFFPDSSVLYFGDQNDLRIQHNGSHSFIQQYGTGDLYIDNTIDDKSIIFRTDDGSGGVTTYLKIDGGSTLIDVAKNMRFADSIKSMYGASSDLQVYHNGTNSFGADNYTGHLIFQNRADDSDIIFKTDDGSGGVATYLTLDGSGGYMVASKYMIFTDGQKAEFGSSEDLQIYHDGSHSYIDQVGTGHLHIRNTADDKHIIISTDNGSGGVDEYMKFKGDENLIRTLKNFRLHDSVQLQVGTGADMDILHDGSNATIRNGTGNLSIEQQTDDGDLILKSDDGSGGTTAYLTLDGSATNLNFHNKALVAIGGLYGNSSTLNMYANTYYFKNTSGGVLGTLSGSTLDIPNTGDWSFIKNNTNSGGLRFGTKDSGGTYANQIEISNTGNYVKLNENTTISGNLTVTGTISGTVTAGNATTLDGYDSSRFFRRQGIASATVGPGWVTVATNTSGRQAGEILVTDADSGDHGFIRIHWLRSFADSNFTVINCGGHQNRITGVRVLSQDSDNTYGEKVLQVYVTVSSSYDVKIFRMGDDAHYGDHTVHTPTVENTISGYSLHGNQLEDLNTYGFAHEEGIQAGGVIKTQSNMEAVNITASGRLTTERIDITESGTVIGDIQSTDSTWLRLNQSTNKNIYTPRYIRADSGFFVDGASQGITGAGVFRAPNGSAGTPTISFSNDTNTGIYRYGADQLGFATGGAHRGFINSDGNWYNFANFIATTNGTGYLGRDTGGTVRSLLKLNTSNIVQVGDVQAIQLYTGSSIRYQIDTSGNHNIYGNTGFSSPMSVQYGAIFNEGGHDSDTRIEGSSDANLVRVDAGNDRVGIGTGSPSHKMHIVNTGTQSVLRIDGDGDRGANRYALDVQDDDANKRGVARFRHTTGSGNPPIVITEGHDHAYIFQSKNTSASDAEQFRIEHSLGNVRMNSLRGSLCINEEGGQKVGINTDSPSFKLDLNGDLRIVGNGDHMLRFSRSGADVISIEQDSSQLYFYNRTTSKVTLLMSENGNVRMGHGSNPVFEIRNEAASAGSGGILTFGHNQGSNTTEMGSIRSHLIDGSAANRAGNLEFWTSRSGSEEMAAVLGYNNHFFLYQEGDTSDYMELTVNDTHTEMHLGSGNYLKLSTDHGYLLLGPQNSSHCHYTTDRSNHWFNTRVVIEGGVLDSYNENLNLRRASSDADRIEIAADYSRILVNGSERFRATTSGATITGHAYATSSYLAPDGSAGTPAYRFNNDGDTGMYRVGADALGFSVGGNIGMQLTSAHALRIYQSDDTTDYIEFYANDTHAFYHHSHGTMHRFITDSGYIELGPANSSWGHIQTDRSKFYFNKQITVDSGIITSYDEDLSLRRADSSADRIDITADYTRVIVNNAEEFRVDGSGSRTLGISRADNYFQKNASGTTGCLLKLVNSGWTNATTHDIIFNGYGSTLGDYTYLKSAGNGTNTHGMLLNSDNYLFWGRDNLTTGTVDNSATAPMTDVCMRVDASGNALFDGDVVAFSSTIASDARLKENVEDLNYGLKDVLDMRAVSFDWIDKRNGQHDIGVIAQEIEKIIPEVVVEVDTLNSEDTHKTVDYAKLTSVLITAIQEQQVQIDELKTKLGE